MQLCWLDIDTSTELDDAADVDERFTALAHCTMLGFFAYVHAVAILLLSCHPALLCAQVACLFQAFAWGVGEGSHDVNSLLSSRDAR